LWRLAESLEEIPDLEKKFADPKQLATTQAEQLPAELIKQLKTKLQELKLDRIDRFLPGVTAYLSEPKPQAYFEAPSNPLNAKKFLTQLGSKKLVCNPQSRILSLGKEVFCNGENVTRGQTQEVSRAWQLLAAEKSLLNLKLKDKTGASLYEAYLAGWLNFKDEI
jgi:50S ribosomal protein L16 3-hydroxylase